MIIVIIMIIIIVARLLCDSVTVLASMECLCAHTAVCEKTLLRRRIYVGILAFRAPNQGLESSFCLWTAGQGLA